MGFSEQGIDSDILIESGLRKARGSGERFLPSFGEFAKWCRDGVLEVIGLPTEKQAFAIIHRVMKYCGEDRGWHKYHVSVYWSFRKLDWYNFSLKSEDQQRRVFSDIWDDTKKRAINGFKFPDIPLPLEEKSPIQAKPETAERHLKQLKELFND